MIDLARRLEPRLNGSNSTRSKHLVRARKISLSLAAKFNLKSHEQLRVKHLRWFMDVEVRGWGDDPYYYWLTVKLIVRALDKTADWLPHLKGEWCRDGVGGRRQL